MHSDESSRNRFSNRMIFYTCLQKKAFPHHRAEYTHFLSRWLISLAFIDVSKNNHHLYPSTNELLVRIARLFYWLLHFLGFCLCWVYFVWIVLKIYVVSPWYNGLRSNGTRQNEWKLTFENLRICGVTLSNNSLIY